MPVELFDKFVDCFIRWGKLNPAIVRMWISSGNVGPEGDCDEIGLLVQILTAEHVPGMDLYHDDVLSWEQDFSLLTGHRLYVTIYESDNLSGSFVESSLLIFEDLVRAHLLTSWQNWAKSA